MVYNKITNEDLSAAVPQVFSYYELARHLGMGRSGSNNALLKRRCDDLELDRSHFTGQAYAKGRQAQNRSSAADILVHDPARRQRQKPYLLRRSLKEIGRKYECENCGLTEEWNGRPLSLEVDHIDQNPFNNIPSNLRFLCPNCHSQV